MKKGWWIFIGIIVLIVLVLGFFGFVPGLSNILGANKPKDLGVKYSEADLAAGRAMTGVTLEAMPATDKSLAFSGSKSISGTYTNEIITAMINGAKYKYYPITNAQVKISDDGTIETSGNFNISKAVVWSNTLGGDKGLGEKAQSYIGTVSSNPSFYLKGKMTVVNNQITLNIDSAKISRFNAPKSIIDQYQGQLADFVGQRIANIPGMNINSAMFAGSKMVLDGSYPAVEKSVR